MAVNQLQFAREFEKARAAGISTDAAMKSALKKSQTKTHPKKKKREPLHERIATLLKELYYGPKTYAGKQFKPTGKRK